MSSNDALHVGHTTVTNLDVVPVANFSQFVIWIAEVLTK